MRILIVDDQEANLRLLRRTLERAGYTQVHSTADPTAAPDMFGELRPDLVVLDLHMPKMNGFELMQRLAAMAGGRADVPLLVLTGDDREEAKRRALESGAREFITKPFSPTELVLRVRNLLEVQQLHERLRDHNARLQREVAEQTRELEQARLEILARLALAAEFRDDETQQHAWRIGRTCGLLAAALGLPDAQVELIRRAAPLHDIGKIGIPDAILLKPGALATQEYAAIKKHTTIGAHILSGSHSSVLLLAERIALTHHERWDGDGYPGRLRAEDIPMAGRIVAVADVFDALTHARPYKSAWPVERAVGEVLRQRGRQFDPDVVDAFSTLAHPALLNGAEQAQPRSGRS
jgi:putative two-component system response regulator